MLHTPYLSFKLSSAVAMAHGRQLWDALWSMDSLVARRALGPEAPLTCCYEFLQVGSIMAAAPFYHFTLPLKSGDNSYGRLNRMATTDSSV